MWEHKTKITKKNLNVFRGFVGCQTYCANKEQSIDHVIKTVAASFVETNAPQQEWAKFCYFCSWTSEQMLIILPW